MRSTRCTSREVLAGDGFVSVERCACGAVHLSIGATTLHLSDDAVRLVSSILSDATDVLDRRDRLIDQVLGKPSLPGPSFGADA
jgi:hypothetical protein